MLLPVCASCFLKKKRPWQKVRDDYKPRYHPSYGTIIPSLYCVETQRWFSLAASPALSQLYAVSYTHVTHGNAAHLCKDFTRGYCPRHSLLFNYHDILSFEKIKVKGCKHSQHIFFISFIFSTSSNCIGRPSSTWLVNFRYIVNYFLLSPDAWCKIILLTHEFSFHLFPATNCSWISNNLM
jgi:hypothetical protein